MTKTQKMVLCALFTALIAIGAFIQIPVPYLDYFTLQFFFVLLAGILLGPKLGAAAVAVYVAIGLAGIPIFAAGGGITYVLRPSFGYLIGFIAAAFVTGKLCGVFREKKFGHYLLSCLGGFIVTYGIGIVYKYMILKFYMQEPLSIWIIFLSCFPIDIPGDIFLCILASTLGKRLETVKSKFGL